MKHPSLIRSSVRMRVLKAKRYIKQVRYNKNSQKMMKVRHSPFTFPFFFKKSFDENWSYWWILVFIGTVLVHKNMYFTYVYFNIYFFASNHLRENSIYIWCPLVSSLAWFEWLIFEKRDWHTLTQTLVTLLLTLVSYRDLIKNLLWCFQILHFIKYRVGITPTIDFSWINQRKHNAKV